MCYICILHMYQGKATAVDAVAHLQDEELRDPDRGDQISKLHIYIYIYTSLYVIAYMS